uniref:eIF-4F 25 kDa subunit n=1 Tax=Acrobeloides nanus TaxID=290746 RepID=A0A914DA14_9BILA
MQNFFLLQNIDSLIVNFILCSRPLRTPWTLWYLNKQLIINKENWKKGLNQVCDITTIGEFWEMIREIKTPIQLSNGDDYYLFRKGINPEWEDKANKIGGRWNIDFDKKKREILAVNLWEEIMIYQFGLEMRRMKIWSGKSAELCRTTSDSHLRKCTSRKSLMRATKP